jgi:hypothetical protein
MEFWASALEAPKVMPPAINNQSRCFIKAPCVWVKWLRCVGRQAAPVITVAGLTVSISSLAGNA